MFSKGVHKYLMGTVSTQNCAKEVAAFCWLDTNRRHFITSVGNTGEVSTKTRVRWRKHDGGGCPT